MRLITACCFVQLLIVVAADPCAVPSNTLIVVTDSFNCTMLTINSNGHLLVNSTSPVYVCADSVTVGGGRLEFAGATHRLTAQSIYVGAQAHICFDRLEIYATYLNLSAYSSVQGTGRIRAPAWDSPISPGYPGGCTVQSGGCSGRGGSHGGTGGSGEPDYGSWFSSGVYDNHLAPNMTGAPGGWGNAGSGGPYIEGGAGGGALLIWANIVTLFSLSAINADGSSNFDGHISGGGAGGSIYIKCRAIYAGSQAPTISVIGGGANSGGGGGGGFIAVDTEASGPHGTISFLTSGGGSDGAQAGVPGSYEVHGSVSFTAPDLRCVATGGSSSSTSGTATPPSSSSVTDQSTTSSTSSTASSSSGANSSSGGTGGTSTTSSGGSGTTASGSTSGTPASTTDDTASAAATTGNDALNDVKGPPPGAPSGGASVGLIAAIVVLVVLVLLVALFVVVRLARRRGDKKDTSSETETRASSQTAMEPLRPASVNDSPDNARLLRQSAASDPERSVAIALKPAPAAAPEASVTVALRPASLANNSEGRASVLPAWAGGGGGGGGGGDVRSGMSEATMAMHFSDAGLVVVPLSMRSARNSAEPTAHYQLQQSHRSAQLTEMLSASTTTLLGTGLTADVFRVKYGKEWVAVKKFKHESPAALAEFHAEVSVFTRVGEAAHPHLLGMHFICSEANLYAIVEDLADGGTLKGCLDGSLSLSATARRSALAGIASGMDFLHANGIVHLDLKPANVLRMRNGTVKVADFGASAICDASDEITTSSFVGTPHYAAPERMTTGRTIHLKPADVYSFGVSVWSILVGQIPFSGTPAADIPALVAQQPVATLYSHSWSGNDDLAAVVTQCCDKDPSRRPSFSTLLTSLAAKS